MYFVIYNFFLILYSDCVLAFLKLIGFFATRIYLYANCSLFLWFVRAHVVQRMIRWQIHTHNLCNCASRHMYEHSYNLCDKHMYEHAHYL